MKRHVFDDRRRFRRTLPLLAAFLLAVALATHVAAQKSAPFMVNATDIKAPIALYSASYALVIGIDAYDIAKDGWSPLNEAVNDAVAVADTLEAQGFAVTLKVDRTVKLASGREVKGQRIDRDALVQALETFVNGPGRIRDARLMIWFAGHGHTVDRVGYLVPAGAPNPALVPAAKRQAADDEFRARALNLKRFGEYMEEIRARHVLAIFDSCFSGTVFRNRGAEPTGYDITSAAAKPVRHFIASGDQLQVVADDGKFRELFVNALTGKPAADGLAADQNGDGLVTATELGRFLTRMVTYYSPSLRQTPQSGKLADSRYDEGEVVFRVASAPAAAPVVASAGAQPKGNAPSSDLQPPLSAAAREWQDVKGSSNRAVLEAFRDRHKADQVYAGLADEALAKLPIPKPAAAKPAEAPPAPAVPAPAPARPPVWAGPKPGDTFRDCADCPEMVVVPAGSFLMGSPESEKDRSSDEGPQRKVTIARPFAVGKFEVTFAEWEACVKAGGCTYNPGDKGWGRGKRAVINVSWNDAKVYVGWLSKKTGQSYRLLTEAEWEYAARAGTTTPFYFGETISAAQANYNGTYTYGLGVEGPYRRETVEVGSLNAPNAFGLHDVHGNVWEWVEDCYADSYRGAPVDGSARQDTGACPSRILRGGSWINSPRYLRTAAHISYKADDRYNSLGFRLARTLDPTP